MAAPPLESAVVAQRTAGPSPPLPGGASTAGTRTRARARPARADPGALRRRPRRARAGGHARLVAAVVSTLVVLFIIGAGGFLASRQLYFIGTNPQGIVTIYRGLPYDLPAGIRLYESFYVSGIPATSIPADRRNQVLNHHLRSQSDASNLVKALELGQVSK